MSLYYIKQYGFKALWLKYQPEDIFENKYRPPPQVKSVFTEVQDTLTLPDGQDANVSC